MKPLPEPVGSSHGAARLAIPRLPLSSHHARLPLERILAHYRVTSQTQKEKGTYFRYEASHADLYSDVWLFADWAKEIGTPEFGISKDKDSGIVNDANLWATETMGNPKYPLELFLRVITHEICHLKHPDHSPKFRALLQQLCPDWKRLKERLESMV